MQTLYYIPTVLLLSTSLAAPAAFAQHEGHTSDASDHPDHRESAQQHQGDNPPLIESPVLPEGMSLDDVFDFIQNPPADFPDPIDDNAIYSFVLFDQLEYRAQEEGKDQLGWDAQAWIGYDFDRIWFKTEGESVFDGTDEGKSENDLVYSRLISPFWYAQVGVQYANEWSGGNYDDRYSGVVALQGLAPGMFQVDASFYLSDDADVTALVKADYDFRLTQRLVLQPRVEFGVAAQDIPERQLGAGLTNVNLGLRLRYEITRKFAPYIGVRHSSLTGETADIATSMGNDREQLFFVAGIRLAF